MSLPNERLWFHLAVLPKKTVGELHVTMSSAEFSAWQIFLEHEDYLWRDQLQHAAIMCALVNSHGGKSELKDFLPPDPWREKPKADPFDRLFRGLQAIRAGQK